MDNFFVQSLTLLTAPPANLVYHLILAFSILAALRPSLISWRLTNHPITRRKVTGLTLLLAAQVILYLAGALAWQGIFDAHLFLPPLDRAVVAFSQLWIVWLWAFPRRLPVVEAIVAVFTLLIVIFLAVNYAAWSATGSSQPYNFTWFNFIWEIFSIYLLLNGCLVLLMRKPNGWAAGLAMFLLILAGYVAQLMVPLPEGDFLGGVRLAMVAAFPLLLALPHRQAEPFETYQASFLEKPHPVTGEKRRFSSDLKTWQAFLDLAVESTPSQFCSAAARAVGQAVLADVCYFVTFLPSNNQVALVGGFDLIKNEALPGAVLDAGRVPGLAKSIKKCQPLLLNKSLIDAPDVETIAQATNFSEPGNLLFVPFVSDMNAAGGLLLLSPYSSRSWTRDEITYLEPAGTALVQMMHQTRNTAHYHEGYDSAQADLQSALTELDQLRNDHQGLVQRFISLRAQASRADAGAQDKASEPGPSVSEGPQTSPFEGLPQLHQATTTILGYTELLLGETLGNLAIPQRKFLEQIRGAAAEANQVTEALMDKGSGPAEIKAGPAESVDLIGVVEQAIRETATQKLDLRCEMPEWLPPVRSVRDALLTALKSILEEAALSEEPSVSIALKIEEEVPDGCVKLTVHEPQTVFQASDLPSAFATARNDNGHGEGSDPSAAVDEKLVDAIAQIKAQAGTIWVDQEAGAWTVIGLRLETIRE